MSINILTSFDRRMVDGVQRCAHAIHKTFGINMFQLAKMCKVLYVISWVYIALVGYEFTMGNMDITSQVRSRTLVVLALAIPFYSFMVWKCFTLCFIKSQTLIEQLSSHGYSNPNKTYHRSITSRNVAIVTLFLCTIIFGTSLASVYMIAVYCWQLVMGGDPLPQAPERKRRWFFFGKVSPFNS